MLDIAITAFVTFFVVIDPLGMVPVFIALTEGTDAAHKRAMAMKGVGIACLILVLFALGGEWLLERLGIGISAFRIAGGLMLFLIAVDMVFDKRSQRRDNSVEVARKERAPEDISVFPLAIPLMAGPGSITSVLLLMGSHDDLGGQFTVLLVLCAVLLSAMALFWYSAPIERLMGRTVTAVFSRLLGVILAALAVQYVLDGVGSAFFT